MKSSLAFSNRKLLLVDDEESNLTSMGRLFSSSTFGFRVTTAESAEKALSLVLSSDNDYDIIISDINMKGMDGFAFLTSLRKMDITTPVILMTGDRDSYLKAKGRGNALEKPLDMNELIEMLNETLTIPQKGGEHGRHGNRYM